MMPRVVGIVGASGFIGSECARALAINSDVRRIPAPRFQTGARSLPTLTAEIDLRAVDRFAENHLNGIDVIVNAAGIASATSTDLSSLLGANSLLPLFLARAATAAGVHRLVHVSSAAVQGRITLNETEQLQPESHYALSKAIGEILLRDEQALEIVHYRPTSVHGPSRLVTQSLLKLSESRLAAVASPGDDPSPQMPVVRAGEAVRVLVTSVDSPPRVVLHPWEGATTRSVLALLGEREPRTLNREAARRVVAAAYAVGRGVARVQAQARRLEMVLFGQRQTGGWLGTRLTPLPAEWLRDIRSEVLENGQRHQG